MSSPTCAPGLATVRSWWRGPWTRSPPTCRHWARRVQVGACAPRSTMRRSRRGPRKQSVWWLRRSSSLTRMEFRRINGLPPYVFADINALRDEARRAGRDVVDLGFGNPDIPSPEIAVDKLAEAAHNTRNHRYSASRGIPKLREAVSDLYRRRFYVELDPDSEVINTIGAKEGFSHLMWVLLQPGDAALVPSPSYPIHIWGPYFAGADARETPIGPGENYVDNVMAAWEYGWPKPRVVV